MNKLTKTLIIQGICFGLCFFVFQLTEFTVNDRAGILLGADSVNLVYSIGIACTALGFLSFSLMRKIFTSENARKIAVGVVGAISVAASILLITIDSTAVFLLSAFLALLSYGNIGGNIYHSFALLFYKNCYTGRVIGVSMGCAVLLQFIVQNLVITDIAFIISVCISVAVLICFEIKPSDICIADKPEIEKEAPKTDFSAALTIILATILMSFVISFIDGVVVQKHAEGSLSVSSYSRLFYAASLPVAGFIADIKNRKYMSLVTICVLFISTISTAFISEQNTFFLATASMYTYSGFYVTYFTISFIDFAPDTKSPAMWAGMGRVLRSVVAAVTAIPTVWFYELFGTISLIIGSCVLSVLTLLVLLKSISRSIFVTEVENDEPIPKITQHTKEENIIAYSEHFGFTQRERDTFEKLITTEDGVQEIADSMYVSRRVLQRYISSIYEKTGTKSRIGLFQSFYDYNNE